MASIQTKGEGAFWPSNMYSPAEYLLLCRCSKPAWTRSCATCCRWPCFGRGGGLDDLQRSLPTPTILWFCVILWR